MSRQDGKCDYCGNIHNTGSMKSPLVFHDTLICDACIEIEKRGEMTWQIAERKAEARRKQRILETRTSICRAFAAWLKDNRADLYCQDIGDKEVNGFVQDTSDK